MFDLTGHTALVTGAGQGMGLGVAMALAAQGARVAVNDYYKERAEKAAAQIREAGGTAIGIGADVTDPASIKAMIADIETRMPGRKDAMIRALANVRPSHLMDRNLFDFANLTGNSKTDGAN